MSDGAETEGKPGAWLPVAAAARKLGITARAVRFRIDSGKLPVRPRGNTGREVWVAESDHREPTAELPPASPVDAEEAETLREEAEHWRQRAHAEEVARVRAEERAAAVAHAAEATIAAKDALAEELKAMLTEARRPWWRRWM